MNKTKKHMGIMVIAMTFVIGLSSFSQAQNQKRPRRANQQLQCVLSPEQQSQMRSMKVEFLKETSDVRNQIALLKAKRNTLMTAAKPDVKAIYANIDKMSQLHEKLMKKQLTMKVESRALLTEEQQVLGVGAKGNRPMRGAGVCASQGRGLMMRAGICTPKGIGNAHGAMIRGGKGQRVQGNRRACTQMGMRSTEFGLSDDQKQQMIDLRIDHLKQVQPLKNQLRELQVTQKGIISSQKPDMKSLMSNVEKISDIKKEMMKNGVDHRLAVRNILTEDQRVLWDARSSRKGVRCNSQRGHRMMGYGMLGHGKSGQGKHRPGAGQRGW